MADLSPADFLSRLGATETITSAAPPDPGPSSDQLVTDATSTDAALTSERISDQITLPPATQEALEKSGAALANAESARARPVERGKYDPLVQLGARAGIPFDTHTGVPFRVRVAAEKEPTEAEKLASYKIAYGDENVRKNQFGQIVITTTDNKGRTVDRLANPIGLDASDLSVFAASTPELAGSILPLIATRGATLGPGILKALATLGLTTGGAELAGAAKDMYQRWLRGEDINAKEIAGRRSVSATTGLVTGAGLGAGGFVLGRMISPFSNVGRLQLNAREAMDMLNEKYGLNLKLSAAESTGSPILAAGEALESQKPGSRSGFSMFREKNQQQLEQLRKMATGEVGDEELMARSALDRMHEELAPLNFEVENAAREAQSLAEKAIKGTIGTPVDKKTLGNAIELGARSRKAGFDLVNDTNYSAFYDNPKAKERVIGGSGLKSAVDDMIEALPAVEKDVQVPTGLVGPDQRPIFVQGTDVIPVDTPVRSRLEEISRKLSGDGKISINDLKQIRTDVDNSIKTGEAVPGVKEGRLKHYYQALSDAIEGGLKEINDPALTKAWETATAYYKANVGKFEKAGIAELFRHPSDALSPYEMVDRAVASPGRYAAYKEFFGVNSPQLKGVQQAAKDRVLNLGNLGKSVDAAEFASRLEQLDSASPELLKDAFGKNAEMLRREALVMLRAQGKQLPTDELNQALSSGTLSSERLKDMIQAETRRTDAYNNTLVKEVSEGLLKPEKIKPTMVVDRFVFNKNTQPEDLAELMRVAAQSPQTQEDLRRLTFKKALDSVTVVDPKTGNTMLNAVGLHNMLNDPSTSKRLQTVLGDQSYSDLVGVKDYLMPGIMQLKGFSGAGALVSGSQINELLGHGELKAIPQFIKNFLLSVAYTSDPIRGYFSNNVLRNEGKALVVNTAIASAPFTKALLNTFTVDKAKEVQAALKGYVDQMAYRDPNSAQPGPSRSGQGIPWDDFLRSLGEPATAPAR